MTDNEIVKALECCSTYGGSCEKCPAYVKVDRSNCNKVLVGALDIINRQKAEIERLQNILNEKAILFAENTKNEIKAEAIKEVVEAVKPWYKLLCIDEGDWCYQLDALAYNLVKEMVCDDDGNL